MSITEITKERTVDYIQNVLGHNIEQSDTLEKSSFWTISCCDCNVTADYRVVNLVSIMNLSSPLVCNFCKFQIRVEKFLAKSNMSRKDPLGTELSCNDCNLNYLYHGHFYTPFKCYCSMRLRQTERILFEELSRNFPEVTLTREFPVFSNDKHKVDISFDFETEDGTHQFNFEVDDRGHFTTGSPQALIDQNFTENILNLEEDHRIHLIRITNEDVVKPTSITALVEWIREILQNDYNDKLLLVDSSGRYRYNYLNIDDIENYYLFP